jgi:hypothetical protein
VIAFGFGSFIRRSSVVEVANKGTTIWEQLHLHLPNHHNPLHHEFRTREPAETYGTFVGVTKIVSRQSGNSTTLLDQQHVQISNSFILPFTVDYEPYLF